MIPAQDDPDDYRALYSFLLPYLFCLMTGPRLGRTGSDVAVVTGATLQCWTFFLICYLGRNRILDPFTIPVLLLNVHHLSRDYRISSVSSSLIIMLASFVIRHAPMLILHQAVTLPTGIGLRKISTEKHCSRTFAGSTFMCLRSLGGHLLYRRRGQWAGGCSQTRQFDHDAATMRANCDDV